MSFTIKQPKQKDIKPELLLVFTNSVYVLNSLLENLVKNIGKNDFCHLNEEFNGNVLALLM